MREDHDLIISHQRRKAVFIPFARLSRFLQGTWWCCDLWSFYMLPTYCMHTKGGGPSSGLSIMQYSIQSTWYTAAAMLRTACCVYSYSLIWHDSTRHQVQPTTTIIPKIVFLGYRKIPGKYENGFWATIFLEIQTVLFWKSVSITPNMLNHSLCYLHVSPCG